MDVKGKSLWGQLPSILAAISNAHFVSIDFELSGIPTRQKDHSKAPGELASRKQSLQERYEDTKKAAERYQVLQFGMTCVEEDRERGKVKRHRICLCTYVAKESMLSARTISF